MVERDGHAQVLREDHRSKRDATGFSNRHPHPGEEETEEFRVADPEILLYTSVPRYGQSQFDEGGGSRPDQDTCQKPHRDRNAG